MEAETWVGPPATPTQAGDRPSNPMLAQFFPEVAAGGFTRLDGTIAFYTRINALLPEGGVVVDYGAGRGSALLTERSRLHRELRLLKGKVRKVIGVDVDPVVRTNPGLDAAIVLSPDGRIPLPDASVDLIVSDFTFEHVAGPKLCAAELDRILRPGGWLCARTPNRWSYVALLSRLIPSRLHRRVLRHVQPMRETADIFPAYYRMNDLRTLRRLFPPPRFRDASYAFSPEPSYLPAYPLVWRVVLFFEAFCPAAFRVNLFLFFRKTDRASR